MQLNELTGEADDEMTAVPLAEAVEVTGLTADSRKVGPGYLFAALPGAQSDGRDFIDEAVSKGAVVVLAPKGTALKAYEPPVALVEDDNPRRRLAVLAARFYDAQPELIAAVTGTNGKTSVADFTRQIWQHAGLKAASLGTLGLIPAHQAAPSSLTTPDPVELHACLAALAEDGVERLAVEASSHGLDQFRLDGVRVAVAAFTNLSRDHLDYHGGMDSYFTAKRRLFAELVESRGTAVLNADDPVFSELEEVARARGLRVLTYGWAILGAAFGPQLILLLLWRRASYAGCLAGMFTGFATAIIWQRVYSESEVPREVEIYNLPLAFITALIVNIVVSRLFPKTTAQRQVE